MPGTACTIYRPQSTIYFLGYGLPSLPSLLRETFSYGAATRRAMNSRTTGILHCPANRSACGL
jgi:hypothetical protein